MNLKDKAKLLPQSPGIYIMRDSLSNIIYIGKSKNLRKRVYSYFIKSNNITSKVEKLVKNIKDFQYICTDTELEALLLECTFIKHIKPQYNRLMKNHERYVYIQINIEDKYPIIKVVSEIIDDNSLHYGPFISYNRILKFIEGLNEILPLIKCNNYLKHKSTCINYAIGKCEGPCIESISSKQYKKYVDKVISFFHGEKDLIILLEKAMIEYSQTLEFEKAKIFKEYIDVFSSVFQEYKHIIPLNNYNKFIIIDATRKNIFKVIFINNHNIEYIDTITTDNISKENLEEYFKNIYLGFYLINHNNKSKNIVNKEFIDYVHIIFSYIDMKKEDIVYSNIEQDDNVCDLGEKSLKWSNYMIDKLNKFI
ncbi:GIY-YIG nuclease family protein [Clostridium botulinum]|uniref:GIY-YIG nuclease family protein n=1 Tax=Clostridium botulinum TaxID=1491 RepID=UPI000D11741E|nr:GIY-YIG nuclease family protein [Clostridium botulinum]AVQ47368.1 nucleotide excision repair endonuclease [Clostridium botulinum]AVQ50955.1 nucleotide excision repair endonuclease [Clostridium botulinum]